MNDSRNLTDRFLGTAARILGALPRKIVAYRWQGFLAYFLLFGLLVAGLPKFKLNQSMDAFFFKDDPIMVEYNWFKYLFGSDERVLVLYQPKDQDVFSQKSLKALAEVEDELNRRRSLEGNPLNRVTRIRTVRSMDWLESNADSLVSRPFLGKKIPQSEGESDALRAQALSHKDYPDTMFSRDSTTAVMIIETSFGSALKAETSGDVPAAADTTAAATAEEDEFDFGGEDEATGLVPLGGNPELEEVQMDAYGPFINEMNEVLNGQEWAAHTKWVAAGNPWLMEFFGRVILSEIGLFSGVSVLIIWLVLLVAFRTFTALVWPTVTLITSLVGLIGLIGWTGIEMTFMINIISFLLLSISMATSIHILSGYTQSLKLGLSPVEALCHTYERAGIPIVLAGVTTAIGLLSLTFVPVLAIRNFGIFASTGVVMSLIINLLLWPLLLSLWAPNIKDRTEKNGWLEKFLSRQRQVTIDHSGKILIVFGAVIALALTGLPKVFIDTNFVNMIRSGYGMQESYELIDKYFGGTGTIEVVLDTGKQDGVKDPVLLRSMDDFNQAVLKRDPMVTSVFSLVSVTKDAHRHMSDGSESEYRIPASPEEVSQVLLSFESADPASRKLLVEDNWQAARTTFALKNRGSKDYNWFMKEVKKLADKHFTEYKSINPDFKIYYSGGVPLTMSLVELISTSQLRSFALALSVICLVLFILFSSLKFGILAIIPNVFPLAVVMGFAGWFGIPMDSDTLLVVPIAIGIAVDDTIHFLTHFKSEIVEGHSVEEALDSALVRVGRAMTFTSIVLTLGFSVFLASAYIPLGNFGILSAVAIFSALLADLFLLPVLIRMFGIIGGQRGRAMPAAAAGLLVLVGGLSFLKTDLAQADPSKKGTEIAQKMIERDDGSSVYNKTILISCGFKENGGKRKCTTAKRKKVFESLSKDLTADQTKSLSIIVEPAAEKGVAMLQQDFETEGKDSNQWMYLPSMKKLKQIVSADDKSPKTGTMFGSEIAYEEIEKLHLSDYTFKLLREEKLGKSETWVLESIPTAKRAPKTSYGRTLTWVDKSTYLPLKNEMYSKQGKLVKTFLSRKIVKISGVWIAQQMIVVNHKSKRMSMLKITGAKINIPVADELFSSRALNDGDFREKKMGKIR